jgi:site-specific DNA-methyltransferase (adenine-specific)
MQIVDKLLSDIKPYAKNPRKNDKAVDKVAASIKEFGWKVPIVIDQDGTIVAGHTRYKAAQQLGLDRVPCIIADDLTPEQVKAFRLADNKVGELAGWDFDLLATELQDLASFDMEQFGFERDPSQDLTDVEEDDFEEEKETTDHGVQIGQVWILGNHRVMCGDSTSKTDADRLMGGGLS